MVGRVSQVMLWSKVRKAVQHTRSQEVKMTTWGVPRPLATLLFSKTAITGKRLVLEYTRPRYKSQLSSQTSFLLQQCPRTSVFFPHYGSKALSSAVFCPLHRTRCTLPGGSRDKAQSEFFHRNDQKTRAWIMEARLVAEAGRNSLCRKSGAHRCDARNTFLGAIARTCFMWPIWGPVIYLYLIRNSSKTEGTCGQA